MQPFDERGAFAMITKEGKVALGVPQTDVEDVKQFAHFANSWVLRMKSV